MTKPIFGFCIRLLLILSIVFATHSTILYFLKLPLYENLIVFSYIINGVLAILIFLILDKLRVKYLDLLGFIYMGGSLLKFVIYFIFFNPTFKQDGSINNLEATSFLTPYIICLLVETYYLIKLLNNKS